MTPLLGKITHLYNLTPKLCVVNLTQLVRCILDIRFQDARDVLETFQRQPFLGRSGSLSINHFVPCQLIVWKDIVVEFARPLRKDMPSIAASFTTESQSKIRSRSVFRFYFPQCTP